MAELVTQSGVLPALTPELERLVQAIAGNSAHENIRHKNGRSDLDWRRRLALRTLTSSDEGIYQIIKSYIEDESKGLVPSPLPCYKGASNDSRSIQFKVLCALAKLGSSGLADLVQPSGFTKFHNDNSLSFFLATILAGSISFELAPHEFETICCSFASQLICEGEWAWGTVIMLSTLPGATAGERSRRIRSAKSIVARFYRKNDEGAASARHFLEDDIGVPNRWFSEALSNQEQTVVEYVSHTLRFDPEAALKVIETRYLPNVFFLTKGQVDELMRMIEGMANARNSVARGVVRFFRLTERLRCDPTVAEHLDDLIKEQEELSQDFKSHLSTITGTGGHYRFYVEYPMRVSLPSMLRTTLDHLSDISLQIAVLSHNIESSKFMNEEEIVCEVQD